MDVVDGMDTGELGICGSPESAASDASRRRSVRLENVGRDSGVGDDSGVGSEVTWMTFARPGEVMTTATAISTEIFALSCERRFFLLSASESLK